MTFRGCLEPERWSNITEVLPHRSEIKYIHTYMQKKVLPKCLSCLSARCKKHVDGMAA